MKKLYQAEWCPFSHRIRAKLTELGIDYEAVNVSASAEKRVELKEITGNSTIPVLADGEKVFSDSSEILSYLGEKYETSPEELKLHQRELSPTIYGTLPFAIDETIARLREALQEADVEIIGELDLSSLLDGERTYKVLLAADKKFMQLAAGANLGAATLALLKVAVYEQDGVTRVDAIEPEKAAAQIRNSEVNERGLELRKRFIRLIKALKHTSTGGK
ncbi:MAG: glutathione S-transferase N-terminal domain-containing protein [Actinomycetota bacterium]|nr:glutathione S-transferase N-terminal domain-containing protein [Actinomycetota bacterium]